MAMSLLQGAHSIKSWSVQSRLGGITTVGTQSLSHPARNDLLTALRWHKTDQRQPPSI